jgi:hypothetical protein
MIKEGDKVWLKPHDCEGEVVQVIKSGENRSYIVKFNRPMQTILAKKDLTLIEG